jgi:WD40 repeat protein/serine/threonine protein kinase
VLAPPAGIGRLLVATPALGAPRVLGDFELHEVLGEGGFGTVYRAEQRTLERGAVVKVIRGALAGRHDAIERFLREARLASRFDHPYAAHVYAFGAEPDGLLWIAMELVRGTPLDVLIAAGPMAIDRFVPLFERLCEVIQAAHDQGIVHRDIKPSNVMVIARGGRLLPKLLDFGIAKRFGLDDAAPPAPVIPAARAAAPTLVGTGRPAAAVTPGPAAPPPAPDATSTLSVDRTVAPPLHTHDGITQVGQALGSPPYMAPEQWVDPARVGPAADQYALAMLAYEALAGTRPYRAETRDRLAELHRSGALPALPASVPAALHAVLARAAAKQPADRYPSLDQLAAELRAAALGHADERAALPGELHALWLAAAPRPIAEAVAALAAARTPARIADRARAVAAALAHWLGLVALAARAQLGKPAGDDDKDLLRTLRRRPLRDDEWLALAAALVRPYARRPEAWPVPEQVALPEPRLRQLLDDVPGDDDAACARRRIALLGDLLGELEWLLDYEVVRERADGPEPWTGVATPDADVVRDPDSPMVLVDADGARVAALSPLVQVLAPAPGEPPALFVLAGPGRDEDGARLVAGAGFEREVDGVWPHLAIAACEPDGTADAAARSPYPGLAAFTAADRASFVGREREVEDAINRLHRQRVLAVVGPSGAGKTSFLAAGVIPALPAGWTATLLRPGDDPLPALTAALAPRPGVHVIVVDQAEELITLAAPEPRAAFAAALAAAWTSSAIRVVIGVRDDFLCRLDELPAFRGALGRAVQILGVPDRDELERIVALPARRHDHTFDDGLARDLAAEVAGRPGALPLLAFAAAALWDQRDRHFQRLTRAAYDRIGGVVGALVRHADGVVDALPVADRRLVRRAFGRLLGADGTRTVIARDALIAALAAPSAAAVVDQLIAARLIASRDDDAGDRLEIVHEALATTWPRLAAWRRDDAQAIHLHAQLAAAARAWDERGRRDGQLWRGDALDELRRHQGELALTATEQAFAAASLAAAAAARRRRRRITAAAFAALVAALAVLGALNHRIAAQHRAAVAQVAAELEDRARRAMLDDDALHGLLYLSAARALGRTDVAADLLAARAAATVDSQTAVIARGLGAIYRMVVAPGAVVAADERGAYVVRDGKVTALPGATDVALAGDAVLTLAADGSLASHSLAGALRWSNPATEGGTGTIEIVAQGDLALTFRGPIVHIWRATTGAPLATLTSPTPVRAAAFDPAGARIATGGRDGAVRVWSVATGALLATCTGHTERIERLVFLADAVVSASLDKDVRICDPATGAPRHRLQGHTNRVTSLTASPDGHTIASTSTDGTARLWDLATGELRGVLAGHRGAVVKTVFAPDGQTLATAGSDGTVWLWDAAGVALGSLQGHAGRLDWIAWDGATIITGGFDGSIRRWDPARALLARSEPRHAAAITAMQISRDGRWVATGAADGTIVLAAGGERHTVKAASAIAALELAPDTSQLISIDDAGHATLWTLPGLASTPLDDDATAAAFTATAIITGGHDRVARIRDRAGALLTQLPIPAAPSELLPDPSGRWLTVPARWGEPAAGTTIIDLATRAIAARLPSKRLGATTSIDDHRLATTDGNDVQIWELGTWRSLARLVGHTSTCYAMQLLPDGRVVTVGNDLRVLVWSADYTLRASLPLAGVRVFDIDATADGALLVTDGSDGTARIWDLASYRELLALPSHHQALEHARLTPDGQQLLTGGADGRVVTWTLARPARTAAELARLVRCRVPLQLDGDVALPRALALGDPTCP